MNVTIEDLVQTGENLCRTLDRAIEQERRFGADLCQMMEQVNYSISCSLNDLKTIKYQMVHDGTGTEI